MQKKLVKKVPGAVEETEREFKRRKRKEFNEALRAMRKLVIGCAYMPATGDVGFFIGQTYKQMQDAKKKLEKWWKNA